MPLVSHKFTVKNYTFYELIHDAPESFEALIVLKSLAQTTLVYPRNFQGHAGTNKTYSLFKRHLFWKGMK